MTVTTYSGLANASKGSDFRLPKTGCLDMITFGEPEWAAYFGEIDANIPPIPGDMAKRPQMADRLIKSRTQKAHKYALVLIPKEITVNGQKQLLTLFLFQQLLQNFRTRQELEREVDFKVIQQGLQDEGGLGEAQRPRWILATHEVPEEATTAADPGARNAQSNRQPFAINPKRRMLYERRVQDYWQRIEAHRS